MRGAVAVRTCRRGWHAPLSDVSDAIVSYLRSAAAALRSGAGSPAIEPVACGAASLCRAKSRALRREGLIRGLPGDVAERFFALGFRWSRCGRISSDLDRRVAEWSETPPVKAAIST